MEGINYIHVQVMTYYRAANYKQQLDIINQICNYKLFVLLYSGEGRGKSLYRPAF